MLRIFIVMIVLIMSFSASYARDCSSLFEMYSRCYDEGFSTQSKGKCKELSNWYKQELGKGIIDLDTLKSVDVLAELCLTSCGRGIFKMPKAEKENFSEIFCPE